MGSQILMVILTHRGPVCEWGHLSHPNYVPTLYLKAKHAMPLEELAHHPAHLDTRLLYHAIADMPHDHA